MIAWLKSLFSRRAAVAVPAPAHEHPTDAAGRAELDDELVEIDEDGRIWVHGKEAPTPVSKTNILRDPQGEYGEPVPALAIRRANDGGGNG
jgi:hypothetical protein